MNHGSASIAAQAWPSRRQSQRAAPVDRRLIIGIVAAGVVVALVTVGVLVFVNRSPSAGGGATRASGTQAPSDSPSSAARPAGASCGDDRVGFGAFRAREARRRDHRRLSRPSRCRAHPPRATASTTWEIPSAMRRRTRSTAIPPRPGGPRPGTVSDKNWFCNCQGPTCSPRSAWRPGTTRSTPRPGPTGFGRIAASVSVTWTFDDGSTRRAGLQRRPRRAGDRP